MSRHIYKKTSVALKISLLSCSLPLLLSSPALSQSENFSQNCSQAQIKANIAKFRDSNKYVSQSAAHAVVKCQPESMKPLIEAPNDQSDDVRENAAKALGKIGSAEEAVPQLIQAVPQLIQSLKQDKNFSVRMYVALTIAAMGKSAKEAIPQLILSVQQDENFAVRAYAAGAFIYMGESGKAAIPQLIQSLQQDPDSSVRAVAASTLRVLGVATQ